MRNLLLIVAFVASSICGSAQKVYFIYLQSDNGPFYVKMNDKIYSSENSGYLILSNLADTTYNFAIGFSASQSEFKFVITLAGKDKGFLIKNFDSGLGLFDLQNLTITNSLKDESAKNISYTRRNDDFSSLLSKAAKDTTLLYAVIRIKADDVVIKKEEPKKEEPKQAVIETVVAKDTSLSNSTQIDIALETNKPDSTSVVQVNNEVKHDDSAIVNAKEEPKKDTVVFVEQKEEPKQVIDSVVAEDVITAEKKPDTVATVKTEPEAVFKRSRIRKHSESSTSEGFGLVYYDNYAGGSDTIRLIIPNPPIIFKQQDQDSSSVQKDFIHVDELKKDTVQQIPIVVAVKNNSPVKSECKSVASNNDFFKLRKNMASENTDEGMVSEAKKFFKSKCFTIEQIKNLSALFLTSAGKYQFFDAAYLHVSDQENFSSLQSEIKDDYYLKRFRALAGE
ncbi:MAG TPA: DUF4476 domain-containing protein [Flavisolibacter sp.]|jgi:hypothetical protein|nr:DUF4476 domain-containing protein [Flavisolibacter sp.]